MMQQKPKYFIIDVDGVMTTGQFIYSQNGKEYKVFGPHDNDGIKILSPLLGVLFITADERGYQISKKRIVDDMNRELVLVSESERFNYIDDHFGISNVVYMGDGYYDAEILSKCFYGIAPNNARIEAKTAADYVTSSNSAEGAVMDACLHIVDKFFN